MDLKLIYLISGCSDCLKRMPGMSCALVMLFLESEFGQPCSLFMGTDTLWTYG